MFASSCSVYGSGEREFDESAPLAPKTLYAESKIAGETIVLKATAIQPVVLRFGTVFGVSRRPRFDLVVNLLTAKAAAGEPISVFGGEQWRPFVHVEDIVSAIMLALDVEAELVAGEVFNVGSAGENRRLAEIGEIIAELIPGATVEIDRSSWIAATIARNSRKSRIGSGLKRCGRCGPASTSFSRASGSTRLPTTAIRSIQTTAR